MTAVQNLMGWQGVVLLHVAIYVPGSCEIHTLERPPRSKMGLPAPKRFSKWLNERGYKPRLLQSWLFICLSWKGWRSNEHWKTNDLRILIFFLFLFCFGLGVSRHDFLLLLALTQGSFKTMEIQWKFYESLGLEVKGCYWQKRCMILDFLHAFIATCTVNSCFRFAIAFRKALAAGLQGSLLYWNHRSLY